LTSIVGGWLALSACTGPTEPDGAPPFVDGGGNDVASSADGASADAPMDGRPAPDAGADASIDHDAGVPDLASEDGDLASSYVKLRSVQYRNEDPYSVVNLHLAREVFDLNPERFKGAAALVTIDAMDEITLREAHQTLTIGSADPEIADLLRISIGAPTIEAHCVVIDDGGIAIYVGDITYRSDSIKLQVNLLTTEAAADRKPRNGFKAVGLPRRKSGKR